MPFFLDLLRHGDALPTAAGGDEARELSPAGRRDLEGLAARLAGLGWRPDRAFTSPLPRARESARILVGRNAPHLTLEVLDALRPDGAAHQVVAALAGQGITAGHVLLVGHQPLLGELTAYLTAGTAPAFAPGTLVRIAFPAGPRSGAGVVGGWLA